MKVLMIPSWYPTAEAPLLGTFYKEQAEALAELEAAGTAAQVDAQLRAAYQEGVEQNG